MSNANLIFAAKKCNIPTLGFLDHWKGFDRLFDKGGQPVFCPDWLGVIDKFSENKLCKLASKINIEVVGHPVLEKVSKVTIQKEQSDKLVFISQPEANNPRYEGQFFKNYADGTVLTSITKIVKSVGLLPFYRAHPKENPTFILETGIFLDDSTKMKLFQSYKFFVGFDSILMLEAHLSGAKCIAIHFPEFNKLYVDEIPLPYAFKAKCLNDINRALIDNKLYPNQLKDFFDGSITRCLGFMKNFLSGGVYD
jgi:hypothetical protein